MGIKITIAKNNQTETEQSYLELIYDYFNEFVLSIEEFEDYYEIELQSENYSYCEDLSLGLQMLGIDESRIGDFRYIEDNVGLCLSENWLPYIWQKMNKKEDLGKVAIIHVDDHMDLMSPYVAVRDDQFVNMLTNETIDFCNSDDLMKATESGCITIGSMLTMIIYAMSNPDIFHLKYGSENKELQYCKTKCKDSFFQDKDERIGIEFVQSNGAASFMQTADPALIERKLKVADTIVLHIDMDYFNNRYNGSSNWEQEWKSDDLDIEGQMMIMDSLCDTVKKINSRIPIGYLLMGLSPSFYPTEYWKSGLLYLLEKLKAAGMKVDSLLQQVMDGEIISE